MKHWPLWFFGACTLLTLAVSIPATYAALALWHNAGGEYGWVLAVFALLVFEVGAVGAKLATLAIPEWDRRLTLLTVVLLAATTGANYAHGYDLSHAAQAQPTLAAVLRNPYGGVAATLAAAALFPVLLFVFLSAFTSAWQRTARTRDALADLRAVAERERGEAAALRESIAQVRAELRAAHASLAAERERPLFDVRQAARLLVERGAPEATIRGWLEAGRVREERP